MRFTKRRSRRSTNCTLQYKISCNKYREETRAPTCDDVSPVPKMHDGIYGIVDVCREFGRIK